MPADYPSSFPLPIAEGHQEEALVDFERAPGRPLEGLRRRLRPGHRFRLSFDMPGTQADSWLAWAEEFAWQPEGFTLRLASFATLAAEPYSDHDLQFVGELSDQRSPGRARMSVSAEVIAGGQGALAPGAPEYEGEIDGGTFDAPSESDEIDGGPFDDPSGPDEIDGGTPSYL